MSWYIESWQPPDGLAFISNRPDEQIVSEVFFVGAPQFQLVPVRDLATALWPTRGAFQDGLRIATPAASPAPAPEPFAEARFETLSQAVELVRRMFVVLGPDLPPPGGSVPVPPLPPPDGLGARATLLASQIGESIRVLDEHGADQRRALRHRFHDLLRSFPHDALRSFAVDSLAAMPDGDDPEDRVAVVVLLEKTGLWSGVPEILKEWVQRRKLLGLDAPGEVPAWQGGRVRSSGVAVQGRVLRGLPFRIPSPRTLPWPYERGLWTLGHHLAAGTADRHYLAALTTAESFLPLLCGALLLAAGTIELTPGASENVDRMFSKASAWLSRSLPDSRLARHPGAESLIAHTVTAMAARNQAHIVATETARREAARLAEQQRAQEREQERARRAAELEDSRRQDELESIAREREESEREARDDERSYPPPPPLYPHR
jgi:hypothetical protein